MDEDIEELEQKLHDYKGLVQHPGWKRYVEEVLKPQIELRATELTIGDDDSLEGWAKSRRLVGERQGIKLVIELPATIVEETEEMLRNVRREDDGNSE